MKTIIILSSLLIGSLTSLNVQAQDTLTTYLGNPWDYDTAAYGDTTKVTSVFQNTTSLTFNQNVIVVATVTNTMGTFIVDSNQTYAAGIILNPNDTALIQHSWPITPAQYVTAPGNNIVVIWPVANNTTVKDSLMLNTIIDTTLGIVTVTRLTVKIYPNPTQSVISIDYADQNNIENVRIWNLEGKLVLTSKPKKQIDVSSLPGGSYIVTLTDRNGRKSSGMFVKTE